LLSIPVLSYLAILYLIEEIEHKLNRAKEKVKERNSTKSIWLISAAFILHVI